jgi:hypothetical protein
MATQLGDVIGEMPDQELGHDRAISRYRRLRQAPFLRCPRIRPRVALALPGWAPAKRSQHADLVACGGEERWRLLDMGRCFRLPACGASRVGGLAGPLLRSRKSGEATP